MISIIILLFFYVSLMNNFHNNTYKISKYQQKHTQAWLANENHQISVISSKHGLLYKLKVNVNISVLILWLSISYYFIKCVTYITQRNHKSNEMLPNKYKSLTEIGGVVQYHQFCPSHKLLKPAWTSNYEIGFKWSYIGQIINSLSFIGQVFN